MGQEDAQKGDSSFTWEETTTQVRSGCPAKHSGSWVIDRLWAGRMWGLDHPKAGDLWGTGRKDGGTHTSALGGFCKECWRRN